MPWPASSVAPRSKIGSIDSEGSTRPSEGSSASDAPAYSGASNAAGGGSDQGQYIDPPDQGAPSAEGASSAAPPELGSALGRLDTLTPTDEELPVQLASNGARPCMRSVLALFTAECYPPG